MYVIQRNAEIYRDVWGIHVVAGSVEGIVEPRVGWGGGGVGWGWGWGRDGGVGVGQGWRGGDSVKYRATFSGNLCQQVGVAHCW